MAIQINAFFAFVKKYGEDFCGDQGNIIRNKHGITAILADGICGGTKARLMTSFVIKMIFTLLENDVSIEQIANTVVESQPSGLQQDSTGKIAFTLVQAQFDGNLSIEQFETPDVIFLRHGKPVPIKMQQRSLRGKAISNGTISVAQADTIIAVNSGMLAAGAKRNLKKGWDLKTISAYMVNAYNPQLSAENLVQLLLAAGNSLSFGKPQNDLSAFAIRLRK